MIVRKQKIAEVVKKNSQKKNKLMHIAMAFLFGGSFGLIGQSLYDLFTHIASLKDSVANTLVSLTLITLSVILTAFGLFDKIALCAGAGTFIPIVGFANAMSSSAIEGKSEGPIYGIGSKIFSLVGSVFAYGIFASFIAGILYYIWYILQ